jgi:hypothetical protein
MVKSLVATSLLAAAVINQAESSGVTSRLQVIVSRSFMTLYHSFFEINRCSRRLGTATYGTSESIFWILGKTTML